MLTGSIVALVTPMTPTGEIDFVAFRELIKWHIAAGTDGLVINGTTAEASSLTNKERLKLLQIAVETANGKLPIIAGTGTNSTQTTILETQAAASCGVEGCLVVTPYYNRPTQKGLLKHYQAVAEAVQLPIILYNVPKRTGCDLLPETVAQIAECKNILAIKEATGDLERLTALQELLSNKLMLLSGDDQTAMDFMLQGGHGMISVSANILPEEMHHVSKMALSGQAAQAKELNAKYEQLHEALSIEPNPIPVKWALAKMGKIQPGLRLPLTQLEESHESEVLRALENVGALSHIAC